MLRKVIQKCFQKNIDTDPLGAELLAEKIVRREHNFQGERAPKVIFLVPIFLTSFQPNT